MLTAVLEKMEETTVESMVLDFEIGAWQAVKMFPNFDIKGCVFHWTQSVYRKLIELGMSTAYRERGPIYNYVRQLLALPFLPPGHIRDTFFNLKGKANSEMLKSFVEYIEHKWINHEVFVPEKWSVFNHSIRTNNDIEAWHRRLNCRGGNLSFYKLVPVLLREETS